MAEATTKEISTSLKQRLEIAKSMGISEKCLPPITTKKIAIYRSYEDGGKDPLVLESQYADILPPSTILEGTFSFLDPFASNLYEATKLIRNITRTRMDAQTDKSGRPNGNADMVSEIESVVFEGGTKMVNIETEFALYAFLELHPLNSSGKFKKTVGPYAFFRYDLQLKGRGVMNVEADLSLDAQVAARDMDYKQIFQYAASIPNNKVPTINIAPSDLKRDFRKWAGENPRDFFNLTRNSLATTKLTLAHALDMGFLIYNSDKKAYFMENELFFAVDKADENPVDGLIKLLASKEGEEKLKTLEGMVDYWS